MRVHPSVAGRVFGCDNCLRQSKTESGPSCRSGHFRLTIFVVSDLVRQVQFMTVSKESALPNTLANHFLWNCSPIDASEQWRAATGSCKCSNRVPLMKTDWDGEFGPRVARGLAPHATRFSGLTTLPADPASKQAVCTIQPNGWPERAGSTQVIIRELTEKRWMESLRTTEWCFALPPDLPVVLESKKEKAESGPYHGSNPSLPLPSATGGPLYKWGRPLAALYATPRQFLRR